MTEETNVNIVELKTTATESCKNIGEGIANIMKATENALDDGWQPGTDIPAVLLQSINSFSVIMAEAKDIKPDFKAAPIAAARGILIPVSEGVEEFLKDDGTVVEEAPVEPVA